MIRSLHRPGIPPLYRPVYLAGLSAAGDPAGPQHTFHYSVNVTLPAGVGAQVAGAIRIQADSDIEINRIFSVHDGDYRVSMRDTWTNYSYSNGPVHVVNFAGTPEDPAILLDPPFLPRNAELQFDFTNLIAGANSVFLVFQCNRFYNELSAAQLAEKRRKRWFQYVQNYSLAPGDSVPNTLSINNDSAFYAKKLNAQFNNDASAQIVVSTLGSRALEDRFTPMRALFGRALKPNYLDQPIPMDPSSVITTTIQNGGLANDPVQVCLEGYKEYR